MRVVIVLVLLLVFSPSVAMGFDWQGALSFLAGGSARKLLRVDLVRAVINDRNCDQIIDKRYFLICYDYAAKGARAVAYELDGDKVNAVNIRKRPRFYPERSLPMQYRTYPSDYTRNEWHMDRGHLAPDASFDWSEQSLYATYSMANIVPQYWLINRKMWTKAERYERLAATKAGHVLVINVVDYGDYRRRMRKSGIAVPYGFGKGVFVRRPDGSWAGRCFWYRNDPVRAYQVAADRLRDHEVECQSMLSVIR